MVAPSCLMLWIRPKITHTHEQPCMLRLNAAALTLFRSRSSMVATSRVLRSLTTGRATSIVSLGMDGTTARAPCALHRYREGHAHVAHQADRIGRAISPRQARLPAMLVTRLSIKLVCVVRTGRGLSKKRSSSVCHFVMVVCGRPGRG